MIDGVLLSCTILKNLRPGLTVDAQLLIIHSRWHFLSPSIGSAGTGPGEFNDSQGVSFDGLTGSVLVCDAVTASRFSPQKVALLASTEGRAPFIVLFGLLTIPEPDIIFVVDSYDHQIQVLHDE